MRFVFNLGLFALLMACNASGVSDRTDAPSPTSSEKDATGGGPVDNSGNVWIGLVPEKAIITMRRNVHNMILIDSDASMLSEMLYGASQFVEASNRVEKTQTNKSFDFVSDDHAFITVDNAQGAFKDSDRITVTNKVLTNAEIKNEMLRLLNEQMLKDPEYAQKTIPNFTIITDGDIPANDQQELLTFFNENFPDGQVYVHLIVSPDSLSSSNTWCTPEAKPSNLLELQRHYPNSLRLSLCDPDWYAHFKNMGKRVAYDQGIARLILPADSIEEGRKPYFRFNGMAVPEELVQYDESKRELQIRIINLPANIQSIEIGFKP